MQVPDEQADNTYGGQLLAFLTGHRCTLVCIDNYPGLRVAYIDEVEERDGDKVQKVFYSVLVKALDNHDQDNYLEEAFKMQNSLEEFNENQGVRQPMILGVREHIFTGSLTELPYTD
ncbi:hypothetical protein E2562_033500 [Oryza meyeriana var. granulata]|uniref:Uncharacterized protein n=1 Tax=Oryza meyeriana var. granulata TaxID=110450 RepID=A0A6G1ESA4_9ORYZ|nr:hypothetical protein E2562_033500 [Oryza meyeriana var. granulata]